MQLHARRAQEHADHRRTKSERRLTRRRGVVRVRALVTTRVSSLSLSRIVGVTSEGRARFPKLAMGQKGVVCRWAGAALFRALGRGAGTRGRRRSGSSAAGLPSLLRVWRAARSLFLSGCFGACNTYRKKNKIRAGTLSWKRRKRSANRIWVKKKMLGARVFLVKNRASAGCPFFV